MAINVNRAQEAADLVSNKREKHAAQVTYIQSNRSSGSTRQDGHHDAFASHTTKAQTNKHEKRLMMETVIVSFFLFVCLFSPSFQ